MATQITRAIKTCKFFFHAAKPHPESTGIRRLFAGRHWQVVSIDLVGPFNVTPRQNKMVLVLSDHFTRGRDAIILTDGTTETIVNALE